MKTKLLFLIPTLMHGGAEKVLVNLVNNLDKSKYDVTLYSIFDVGVNKGFLNKDVKYQYKFKKIFRGNSQLMKLCSPKTLYRYFIKEHYDLVIGFLEGPASRIISGCPHPNTKKIAWMHTEMLTEEVATVGFRNKKEAIASYEKFDLVAAVSNKVLEAFKTQLTNKIPVKTVYNVNDTEHIIIKSREPFSQIFDDEILNICSVGKIVEVKGYDRLLEVHKKLCNEGILHHIHILGIGELKAELEKKASAMGVSKSFRFLGFEENPYKYLSKADLYVCSSRREGFSTAVTEALVLGIPVVSTDVSGAKELLGENNEYGIVTENSAQGLYLGLKEILSNPDKLKYYKKKAVERGSFFSTEKTVKEVENLFDTLLNE